MADMKGKTREEVIAADVKELHKLGYAQQLFREMGGFSNFAISFSIISILTGAMLLYGYGLKFAGPIINTVGWPVVSDLHAVHRRLDGRDRLRLPDGWRPVLLGHQAGRRRLGMGDRLVQHARAGDDHRRHRHFGGDLRRRHDHADVRPRSGDAAGGSSAGR